MKFGIIDCGTNTFNLLIAEKDEQGWNVLFENKLAVKLGAGGFSEKRIVPSRMIRGIDALYAHKTNLANFEVTNFKVFATSAIREAKNGRDFVALVKKKLGLEIEVIDGNREAELIYKGISATIDLGEAPSLMIDIGGGSTEFIIANKHEIFWKKSYLLGVSRLHEYIKPEDKMTRDDMSRLRHYLEEELVELKAKIEEYQISQMIGSSGSFDTIYALYKHSSPALRDTPFALLNEIPVSYFPTMHLWLMNTTYNERLKHPAIPSIRAEYIPLASYMVKTVMEMGKFTKMYHSAYALKEGALESMM